MRATCPIHETALALRIRRIVAFCKRVTRAGYLGKFKGRGSVGDIRDRVETLARLGWKNPFAHPVCLDPENPTDMVFVFQEGTGPVWVVVLHTVITSRARHKSKLGEISIGTPLPDHRINLALSPRSSTAMQPTVQLPSRD